MIEELMTNPDFRIACCNLCTQMIKNKIRNFDGPNGNMELVTEFKVRYHLPLSEEEIFNIARNIYCENLANDIYGVNNLKEVLSK